MKKIIGILILVVALLVLASGCTDSGSTSPAASESPAATTSTTDSSFSLNPTPNDQMPSGQAVGAKAYKDPIDASINVEFTGGAGLYMVTSVSTTVYLSDGSIVTRSIEPQAMADVEIQGTKGEDRVTVSVNTADGSSYKIFDEIISYRS